MAKNNFIFEFIEVYRNLPALWQVKSKLYSNRLGKNEQYEILLNKYKEKYPNADRKDVAQKINPLRTAPEQMKIRYIFCISKIQHK